MSEIDNSSGGKSFPPNYPPLDKGFLNALFNALTEAVLATNLDTRMIAYWNRGAESMFGYSAQEVLGRTTEFLYPDVASSRRIHEIAAPVIREQGYWRTEWEFRHRNGSLFPAEATAVPFLQTGGQTFIVYVIRDITERRRAENEKARLQEQLIENSRLAAIGTTAAKLAHEIANPLNGMSLTAQRLERGLERKDPHDAVKSTVRSLTREISRLNGLLGDFRSLSRREKYDLKPATLAAVVDELFATEMLNYGAHGIRVERDFPEDLPKVMADRDKLKQALLNLCKNAVEAMPNGGTLILRGRRSGEKAVLEVGDTGIGISAGVDIFEPFTTTKSSGTGLGLMIVRQIVAAHGGTITYTSEHSKGTTFSLTLPVATG